MSLGPIVVWFRLDLRLKDNPALSAAVASKAPVIPLFIWAPQEEEPWPSGAASRWWLHHSLHSLEERLSEAGSKLTILTGATEQALKDLVRETNASAMYWNRRYEPAVRRRDSKLTEALTASGIKTHSFDSALLFEPWTILHDGDRPFQVFSPFWKACLKQPDPPKPRPAPKRLQRPSAWPKSLTLEDLELMPKIDWAEGLRATWTPGESGANRQLRSFLRGSFEIYVSERDIPSEKEPPGRRRICISEKSARANFGMR